MAIYWIALLCVATAMYLYTRKPKKLPADGVVLITGASAGIGKQTALHLAERGFTVVAGVRKEADGVALKTQTKGSLHYVILDVSKQDQIDSSFATISSICGDKGLYALVNNAGIMGDFGPVENLDIDMWKQVLDVNYFGHIRMVQKFIPLLRKHGKARLINTSSPAAVVHMPLLAPYCSSKAAITVLNGVLRQELKEKNITTILLVPAALRSRLVDSFDTEFTKWKDTVGVTLANYSRVINVMFKFMKSTHSGTALMPGQLAADAVFDALTDEKPCWRYAAGNGPPFFVSALPGYVQDWILTKL